MIQLARDFGFERNGQLKLVLTTDSSAARGIGLRRGAGKIRHLETGSWWVQQAIGLGRFTLEKVDGKKNPADLLTKPLERAGLVKFLAALNLEWR